MVKDVDSASFEAQVVERSREVPVVVDFWAVWCGPCRTLGPAIEKAVNDRGGAVELAKVDVDANQQLAAQFGIRGIPAVKAFRDGKVVAEFVGVQPPARIEEFLDALLPSEAEQLAAAGDEHSLRRALELDRRNAPAATALAKQLLARGESDEALRVLEPIGALDFVADGLRARIELTRAAAADQNGSGEGEGEGEGSPGQALAAAFTAWDSGDAARALEELQRVLAAAGPEDRDRIRRVMVAIFTELGSSHPLATEHRRRLAAALN